MLFTVLGFLFLIAGALFMFKPGLITKINQMGEKLLFDDKGIVRHNKRAGIFFLAIAALMFFFTYLVDKWQLTDFLKKIIL